MNRFAIFSLVLLSVSAVSMGQGVRSKVVQGNQAFEEEKYDAALTKYRDAQVDAPESDLLKYNIANTLAQKKKFKEAMKLYQESLTSDDAALQTKANYNTGNVLFDQQKYAEAIQFYKNALKLNPDHANAKYNLELARKLLKNQQDKQNQQQNQQQNQDQQQQDQQQQQNQDQQDQQQQQQQEQQQNQDQQQQGEQEQQQQEQQQQEQDQQKQEQQQQQQQQQQMVNPEELSKKDAERILQALQEDKEKMKDARKRQVPGNVRVLKDW